MRRARIGLSRRGLAELQRRCGTLVSHDASQKFADR
jgi:hypothetical protein